MYGRGPQTIEQQYSCGSLTFPACVIHGNRSALHICYDNTLTRKEGGSVESGYHPKVIGRMGMVRKSVDVLGVGMRVSDGIPLIVMRMDKQRIAHIEPYEQGRTERIRQRLLEALAAIPEAQYDQNRLEQEMIYYIEKLDINEEKQRLANHLKYFMETMENGHGQGKKLGFIAQEMGREINTTGSKSNQAEMQNIVVKMKDELEQIKEQVLNVM